MDRVGSNILAVAAVAKMCALPLDMEAHQKLTDQHLLIKSLQASILVSNYPYPHLFILLFVLDILSVSVDYSEAPDGAGEQRQE